MTISSVAYIVNNTRQVRGSGVLITPDEVLTAAHVVQDSNGVLSTSLTVSPGYSNGSAPFGSVSVDKVHSASAGVVGTFTQFDYALVHLSSLATAAGTMKLDPNFAGGRVQFAGYPATSGTAQASAAGSLTLTNTVELDGPGLSSGASGGPAWVLGSDGGQYIVGPLTGFTGNISAYTRLTDTVLAQIKTWLAQDGEGTAAANLTPGATVAVPTSTDALDFDKAYYLAQNPDVAAAGVDAEQHYLAYGWKEGRNPNALFNGAFYLAHNADVAAAGVNPLQHYSLYGWKENRDPSASFSTAAYDRANPDVAAAGINPLFHYLNYGLAEGRKAA